MCWVLRLASSVGVALVATYSFDVHFSATCYQRFRGVGR
jgi:hypothetical protein